MADDTNPYSEEWRRETLANVRQDLDRMKTLLDYTVIKEQKAELSEKVPCPLTGQDQAPPALPPSHS